MSSSAVDGQEAGRESLQVPDIVLPRPDETTSYVTVGESYLTGGGTGGTNSENASRRSSFHVERPVYNQQVFDEGYVPRQRHVRSARERVRDMAGKCSCTASCVKDKVLGFFPFIRIMRQYNIRTDLLGDLVAGLTVGIMQIPQGMAYALLASVDPVFGLYVSFFPAIFYFFLGTSRQVSLGTFAVVNLMVGAAVDKAGCSPEPVQNATSIADEQDASFTPSAFGFSPEMTCKIGVATAVTFFAGAIQVLMGVLRLGFITTYLSEPLTRGFTTGCSMHVFTSQVKSVFGLSIQRYNGAFKIIKTYIAVFKNIAKTNLAAFITSAVCIVILALTKEFLNPIIKAKLKAPFPIELLVVVLGTVASHFGKFQENYNITVVGKIPPGIPTPRPPDFHIVGSIITDSLIIAIVSFAISVSMCKIFAKKHNYEIDANQELYAYGITNMGSSFFYCFTAAVSLSRSVVQDDVGGKTQIAGVVAAGLIILVLYLISYLFEQLPQCVLAAIIIVALKGMFLQFKDLKRLFRVSIIDFLIWIVAFLATTVLDVDLGLMVSLGFCLLTVVFRTQSPHVCLLGWVPQTDLYKDVEVYPVAKELPGLKIFRMEASLYYANAEYFVRKLYSMTNTDPRRIVMLAEKAEKEAQKQKNKVEKELQDPTVESQDSRELNEAYTFDTSSNATRHIIIDCTTMGYIDSVGVGTLSQVVSEYKRANIQVYLAGCKAGVRDMLERCQFYAKSDKSILYLSIHDAVLGALAENPPLLAKLSEENDKAIKRNHHCVAFEAHHVPGFLPRDRQKGTNRTRHPSIIRAFFYKMESGRHRQRLDSEPDQAPLLNEGQTVSSGSSNAQPGAVFQVLNSTKM